MELALLGGGKGDSPLALEYFRIPSGLQQRVFLSEKLEYGGDGGDPQEMRETEIGEDGGDRRRRRLLCLKSYYKPYIRFGLQLRNTVITFHIDVIHLYKSSMKLEKEYHKIYFVLNCNFIKYFILTPPPTHHRHSHSHSLRHGGAKHSFLLGFCPFHQHSRFLLLHFY
ncbi:hypothetical protein L6452_09199 [Arctium lappa]|uniref:Uncharacterized protein n=1 Tax=Arctium lappa TaxID=4217 RepID=A0ACB9DJP5_ARCLA|nr:hypothetical protein L6452_09199 [Arctium lappa]